MAESELLRKKVEVLALRSVARDVDWNVGQRLRCAEQVFDSLFRREASEVEDGVAELCVPGRSDMLEVRQDLDAKGVKAGGDEFVANKLAGCKKQIDTLLVSAQPAMRIGLGGEQQGLGGRAVVTSLGDHVPEVSARAAFADFSVGDRVVARTGQFEIIDVIDDGNLASAKFPKNRGREVVVDISDVGDLRAEGLDEKTQTFPRVGRVDGVGRETRLADGRGAIFELQMGYEQRIEGCGCAAFVGHGEESGFVAGVTQQVHEVEQVVLGAAEAEVIFVAKQDSHRPGSLVYANARETGERRLQDLFAVRSEQGRERVRRFAVHRKRRSCAGNS